ncbi:uncharacterized protein LOC142639859 [Castanea sativa]|uniref:uncharacterized protein LOC142639859 n=1 Tax=Castanea sativa TaxID=21020 RepID=UPI003F64FF93
MAMHSKNEALMCKVFPSSLGPVAMRRFDGLGSGSIDSFKELTQAYWEMFNEIDGNFDDVTIRTFKVSLLVEHGLRKSLTEKPVSSVHRLIDRIDKYKRVKKDQQLGKRKAKVVSQDRRDFRNLWYHLEQLVKDRRLQQFLYKPNGQVGYTGSSTQGNTFSRPPLGSSNVIFVTLGRTDSCPSRVITVARPLPENYNHEPKRAKVALQLALSFLEKDKDKGYDVRHVMVDQGSGAKIMYTDLYKGLGLKPEDLTSYDSSLVGFDGKMVIPMGQVKLPVQIGLEVLKVNFIVVDFYSPYTAIVARPWLHTMGVVPSTLHLNVKYPSGDRVEELIGSQSTAR